MEDMNVINQVGIDEVSAETNDTGQQESKTEQEIPANANVAPDSVTSKLYGDVEKIARELREMHRLYHTEFANRLQSMQTEVEHYREIEKGRIFDDVLVNVAKIYSDNVGVLSDIENEKIKKRLGYMFQDILQILEGYGVTKLESQPGSKRNTKHCQVVEREETDDAEKADTVIKSRQAGFYVENRTLVKELVDVYIKKPTIE
ncbi:hypothetical protein AGMMS49975_09940 [Clostridia bacterium]|nr:hypothetical protein AGMMS49975_09940 [Clostridia bacterium]